MFNSGIARIHLTRRHPGSLKIVHMLPSAFVAGSILLLIGAVLFTPVFLLPLLLLALLLFTDASIRKKSVRTGMLAVAASFVQLSGYGLGMISGFWNISVLGRGDYAAFVKNFYR